LPSKAPFSQRFEEAVGQACESAVSAASGAADGTGGEHGTSHRLAVLGTMGSEAALAPATVRWGWMKSTGAKKGKFLTVVCNLETGEPLWFEAGKRKKETLDEFFRSQLVSRQRKAIEAACVDMWGPFRFGAIEQWAPQCKVVYDKFHIMQHANNAIDEVTEGEFFRQGPQKRGLIKGRKWLLLSRWKNLTEGTPRGPEPFVPTEPAGLQGPTC